MQRKNRKWLLLGLLAYLAIIVLAYRWSLQQVPTDGPLLTHIEREEVRKLKKRQAAEALAKAQAPPDTSAARLNSAEPAYVAARYDATHAAFIVFDSESRFSNIRVSRLLGTPTKIPSPAKPYAPLAGLQELWEPDTTSLHFFPKIFQTTAPGARWTLSLGATSTIPLVIERPILAPTGCSLVLGFLASIPPDQQAAFAATQRDYFVVRRTPADSADPQVADQIADLSHWKPSPAMTRDIERQLNDRMKQEVTKIDARLLTYAATSGAGAAGAAHRQINEWVRDDRSLGGGGATLDYDIHAYTLTPDGIPRLFVRARWTLYTSPVFLMTAWFKALSPSPQNAGLSAVYQPPILLFADSSWALAMREGDGPEHLGDNLNFQSVLNEFDADHDGWAELLMYADVVDPGESHAKAITLYLYTDQGLVPMKTPFRRDTQPPESCLDP